MMALAQETGRAPLNFCKTRGPSSALSSCDSQMTERMNRDNHKHLLSNPLDIWLARAAVGVIIALQCTMINNFSVGPWWLVPAAELLLLVLLSVATAWTLDRAQKGDGEGHWMLVAKYRGWIRTAAIWLTALASLANFGSLFQLVQALLAGKAGAAPSLLIDAINIWTTNVIAFALWFWTIDRGGPSLRGLRQETDRDFLFPQMSFRGEEAKSWMPGFVDYLFVAFTNATAFSPTDTLPLSQRAKLLMMGQSAVSLLVVALVAARAVNILN